MSTGRLPREAAAPGHASGQVSGQPSGQAFNQAQGLGQGQAPGQGLGQALRAARRELAAADDNQVLRVVRMVDGLSARGEADGLLAPLRPRLARLAPPRPLQLVRLLFIPAESLIVQALPAGEDAPLLPRAALPPLASLVLGALPGLAAQFDAQAEGATTADLPRVARLGRCIWPQAAGVLAEAARGTLPPCWEASFLPPAMFSPLADGLARILDLAAILPPETAAELAQPLPDTAPDDATQRALLAALTPPARLPPGYAMLLAHALIRLPGHDAPRRALDALRARGQGRIAAQALAACLHGVGRTSTQGSGMLAPQAAEALAADLALLDALAADPGSARRAQTLRDVLRANATRRLAQAAREGLADSLATLRRQARAAPPAGTSPGGLSPAAPATLPGITALLPALEENARSLRRYADTARRLGVDAECARITAGLADATAATHALPEAGRARIIEILCGPDAALARVDLSALL